MDEERNFEQMTSNRQFLWTSSVNGDQQELSALERQMMWFYQEREGRSLYQDMLNTQEDIDLSNGSVRLLMPQYICNWNPASVLEVGCGDGRLFRQLRKQGYNGAYCGIDVVQYIIAQNRNRHPDTHWECASCYQIPFEDSSFVGCFSLYVLEHLVYPERALREMLRVLQKGGRLILVFPDFVEAGRFGSQQLGLSPVGRARDKFRAGRILDALISLYDSRIRLRRALRNAVSHFGPFPVNTRPVCISQPQVMSPDVDALYIASKQEVHEWARKNDLKVEFPCGTEGEFSEQAFMVIRKE